MFQSIWTNDPDYQSLIMGLDFSVHNYHCDNKFLSKTCKIASCRISDISRMSFVWDSKAFNLTRGPSDIELGGPVMLTISRTCECTPKSLLDNRQAAFSDSSPFYV